MDSDRRGYPSDEVPGDLPVVIRPASHRWKLILLTGGALALVAGIIAVIIVSGKKAAPGEMSGVAAVRAPDLADGTGAGDLDELVLREHRERLAAAPCVRDHILELDKALFEVDRYAEVIKENDAFIRRCGPYPYLLWKTYAAHEELKQWPQAAEVARLLIEDRPDDGDFWWWRGKALAEHGDLPGAVAALRQSIAVTDMSESTGPDLMDLAKIARKAGVPCDAAAALRAYIAANDGEVRQRTRDLMTELYLAGDCDKLAGAGEATLAIDPRSPVDAIQARVGDHAVKLLFDPRSGFTLISPALAARLGLTVPPQRHAVYAAGSLRRGAPVVLDRIAAGKASAPQVHALVVDDLPAGYDGVLGASFLWRFEYEVWKERGEIEIREPGAAP